MTTPPNTFKAVFESKTGIGGYSPVNAIDHAFAFDGNSSGCRDHIVWYRPGTGMCAVVRHSGRGRFDTIYETIKDGIGGWDFAFWYDRAFAYDYDHNGKMDHIVCYRCGSGGVFILKHDGLGNFAAVFAEPASDKPGPDSGRGIGGWDLRYPWDRMLAFDYDHSKKNDAIYIYRRYNGKFCVLKNYSGQFAPVYADWCWGFGDFATRGESHYAYAIDYKRTGCQDHILFMFPGFSQLITVVAHQGNQFVTVYKSTATTGVDPFTGFPKPAQAALGVPGQPNLMKAMGVIFDYDGKGTDDHFGLSLCDSGTMYFATSPAADGKWEVKYAQNSAGIGTWDVKGSLNDRCFAFDYDGSGQNDHLFVYRRTTGWIWILKRANQAAKPRISLPPSQPPPEWPPTPVPAQEKLDFKQVFFSQTGVAGYGLDAPRDRCFALDYNHSGKMDHLCLYRPGSNIAYIITNDGTGQQFKSVLTSSTGIGGYGLDAPADRAFAFDYDHSGRMDHICLYRPGTGLIWIVGNNNGSFTPVWQSPNPKGSIGTYDLKSPADRAFAFDFEHSGRRDYMVLYRPGGQAFFILKNENGTFTPVVKTLGFPDFWDFKDPHDRACAFDYDHSGRLDYLLFIRPISRIACIAQNQDGKITKLYWQTKADAANLASPIPWVWQMPIGGWALETAADHVFPYDLDSSGKQDYLCFYRPGSGMVSIVQQLDGGFSPAYQGFGAGLGAYANVHIVPTDTYNCYASDGAGLAGYDLKSPADHCLPFDFNSTGCSDHIVIIRPGSKLLCVVKPINPPITVRNRGMAPVAQAQGGWGQGGWGQGDWQSGRQQWHDWSQPERARGAGANEPPPGIF